MSNDPTNTLRKSYPCSYCEESFDTRLAQRQHLGQSHPNCTPFSCTLCKKGFFTASGLQQHIKDHKGRQFGCEICDMKFKRKHHLKDHLRNKHGLRICPYCPEMLSSSVDFDKHVLQCGK